MRRLFRKPGWRLGEEIPRFLALCCRRFEAPRRWRKKITHNSMFVVVEDTGLRAIYGGYTVGVAICPSVCNGIRSLCGRFPSLIYESKSIIRGACLRRVPLRVNFCVNLGHAPADKHDSQTRDRVCGAGRGLLCYHESDSHTAGVT